MPGERHRDAGPDSVLGPPASLVVKRFIGRERLDDVILYSERMRHRDPSAIAVDLFCWKRAAGIRVCWKKPSDIHIALGDLKLMDREHNRPVDPKLVLLDPVSKSSRNIREFIQAACRDRVIQIAGSDRKKFCHPDGAVNLGGRRLQFADVKPIEFKIDPLLYRSNQLYPARGRSYRATSTSIRYVYFLGSTRQTQREDTSNQNTWRQVSRKPGELSH